MNIIPINDSTLEMVTELNNGVRPELNEDTYFIWHLDEPAEIVSGDSIRVDEMNSNAIQIIHIQE